MAAVDVVSWSTFLRRFAWAQGEHVAFIGPTGQGKSHLARMLLGRREWSVVLGTKPRDETLDGFARDGWKVVREWPPSHLHRRVLLWPRVRKPTDIVEQRRILAECLDDVFVRGGWAVNVDELTYVADTLRLGDRLELLWLQGRALDISLVAAFQRPAWVPVAAYSSSTHIFLWKTSDRRDLKRLAEVGGVDVDLLAATVAGLPKFAFAYANTRSGQLMVSRAPAPIPRR